MNPQVKTAGEIALSTAVTFTILGILYAPLSIGGFPLLGPGAWKVGVLVVLSLLGWCYLPVILGSSRLKLDLNPFPYLVGFIFLALSDYPERNFGYFAHPFSKSVFLILFALGTFLYFAFKKIDKKGVLLAALTLIGLVALIFFREIDGRLIFGDDHPSFLYRLSLLGEQFPKIPFYNPEWNAGYSAREFFATGCLNIYLFLAPAITFGFLNNPYNYSLIVGFIPLIIFPISIYLTQKTIRSGAIASSISVVLALAPSLDFFEWLLRYGTLGFVCSLVLIPLVFVLSYRLLLGEEQLGQKGVLLLLVASSLCFFWTLSVAAFVPLVIYSALYSVRSFSKTRVKTTLIFVTLFLVFNGLWLKTFITESKVAGFVSTAHLPGAAKKEKDGARIVLAKAEKKFAELATKLNPLLLVLGIPGIFLIKEKRFRNLLVCTFVWLFVLAAFGDSIKPQLELRRMNLIAAVLLILPTSLTIEFIFEKLKESKLSPVVRSILVSATLACLLVVPINAAAIYSNRSDIKFQYASKDVFKLSDLLRNFNSGGRVFFFGFILHELGESGPGHQDGGHIAPLAMWSKREIYASHYFHARWSAIDPIPASFRARGQEGIEEFLDLMNVSEVVVFRKEWLKYCQQDTRYREVGNIGRFHVFTRSHYQPNPLIEGNAEILSVKPGEIRIKALTSKVVLKYRYLPLLRVSPSEVGLTGKFMFDEQIGANQTEAFQVIELEIPQKFIDSGEVISLTF
jgi:hypothetical protein